MQELLVICIVAAAGIYLIRRYKPVVTQAFKKNRAQPGHHPVDGRGCASCCGECVCHSGSPSPNHHSSGVDA